MSKGMLNQLPPDTIKLISSSQIITSVCTAVKELLENSIDAGGTIIQIRLENYGLDLIEVKDNGSGVAYDNVQKMFLPGFTSKIKRFEDLDKLNSYGFRGEALAALCKVSKISVTTKTNSDALAMTYDIDSTGVPLSSKPSHLNVGTVIIASNLFGNLPVRKLYLSTKKKMAEELKKTEQLVQSLSIIHPELSVSLIHNKCMVWKKNAVKGLKQSFMQAVSLKTVSKMDHITKIVNQIHVDLIVPKKNSSVIDDIFTNSQNSMHVYVNRRPIICKILSQPVQEHIFYHYSQFNVSFKYAVCLISVNLSPDLVDINLEPNKTKILLKNWKNIVQILDDVLSSYYGHFNYTSTILRNENLEEESMEKVADISAMNNAQGVEGENEENHKTKKPKLQSTDENFMKSDSRYNVDIVSGIEKTGSEKIATTNDNFSSLCSQINKENCVLTTDDEVMELNAILNEKHHSVITANNKNSITRLIERNELQCHASKKEILPEWPSRSQEALPAVSLHSTNSAPSCERPALSNLDNEERKTVEEIVSEIENNVDNWSAELNKVVKPENIAPTKERQLNYGDEVETANFNLSIESVSSQMGKKELKAFTKFARIMRPKILAEFPKLMFTQVAALLVERWKALTPAEIKNYEKIAETVDLNRKTLQSDRKSPVKKVNQTFEKSPGKNLKTLLEQKKRKNKLTRPPRKEITLVTSINKIEKCLKESDKKDEENSNECYRIIGQVLPRSAWLYLRGKEIGHVRHHGLQELITYRKMLSCHSVEKKTLATPIFIDESILGLVHWTVLTSLDLERSSALSKFIVTSDVVQKNGFQIELEQVGNVFTSGCIAEVACSIPQFGVSDLKEALELYLNNGEIGGLESWRPTSVKIYLTNEAVRLHQKSTAPVDKADMEELINTYNLCLRHLPPVCLHQKQIFVPIHHIQT